MNKLYFKLISNQTFVSISLLILLVTVNHGLLLLNDGVYMDGWIAYGLYLNHDAETLLNLFREAGNLGQGYFHLAYWVFSNPIVAYKITAFLCILLSTLLVFLLARKNRTLSLRESIFVSAIFCCYSAYQVHVEIIMVPFIFFYSLFFLGAYTALRAFEINSWTAILLRIISLAFFASSFQLGSLLVFYFPCMLFILATRRQQYPRRNFQSVFRSCFRYCDFLLLPFVFWSLKQFLWTPYGLYTGYNQPSFDFLKNSYQFFKLFFDGAVTSQIINAWELVISTPLVLVSFIIISFISTIILRKWVDHTQPNDSIIFSDRASNPFTTNIYIFLFSLSLLFCAIFPYASVGKYATAAGWGTRLSILISLPIAIGLVPIGRILTSVLPNILARSALSVLAISLTTAFTILTIDNYIRLQARWIKDSSIIANLRTLPTEIIKKIHVFTVDDQYRIPSNDAGYDFYEYAGMFKLAWNEESRVGFIPNHVMDPSDLVKKYPIQRYLLRDFRVGGCNAVLHIRPEQPTMSHAQLVRSYFKYRFFDEKNLQAFLKKVTVLNLTDISCYSN